MSEFFHAIDSGTWEKPEVFRIAELLSISQGDAFLGCLCMWDWFRRNSIDGTVEGVTAGVIDRQVRIPGFASAAIKVGWLAEIGGGLQQPGFEFHLHGIESLKAYRHRNRAKKSGDKKALIDALRVLDPDAAARADHAAAQESLREKRTKRNVIESKEKPGRAGKAAAPVSGPVRPGEGLFLKAMQERAAGNVKVLELIAKPITALVDDQTPADPLKCWECCGWSDELITGQRDAQRRSELRQRLVAWFRRQLGAPDPVVNEATAAAVICVLAFAEQSVKRPGLNNPAAWFRAQLRPNAIPQAVKEVSSACLNAAAKWMAERLVSQG